MKFDAAPPHSQLVLISAGETCDNEARFRTRARVRSDAKRLKRCHSLVFLHDPGGSARNMNQHARLASGLRRAHLVMSLIRAKGLSQRSPRKIAHSKIVDE